MLIKCEVGVCFQKGDHRVITFNLDGEELQSHRLPAILRADGGIEGDTVFGGAFPVRDAVRVGINIAILGRNEENGLLVVKIHVGDIAALHHGYERAVWHLYGRGLGASAAHIVVGIAQ